MQAEFIDHVNIKEVDLGKKSLHLNKKIKNRAEFYTKVTESLMVCEYLNEINDKVTTHIVLLKTI